MKKITNQLSKIILTILFIFALVYPISYGSAIGGGANIGKDVAQNVQKQVDPTREDSMGGIMGAADDFISMGQKSEGENISQNDLIKASNMVYNILLVIGIIVAVIVGIIIGIQFLVGSVAQQAKVKETLIAYVVGCVVVFGAFGIWKLVVTILQKAPGT